MTTSTTAQTANTTTTSVRPQRPDAETQARAEPATKRVAEVPNSVVILRSDREQVTGLFSDHENVHSLSGKEALVAQICTVLNVHAKVEEEVFYPAFKAAFEAAVGDKKLVPEALVEHTTMKHLVSQVQGQEPDGEMFDGKITVLSEYVKRHVEEKQIEMFPYAESSEIDMEYLGAGTLARNEELKPTMVAKASRPE